jgi:peptidylprolyl isomerase
MSKAKEGDTVKVHFEGYLEDGTIFGSTIGEEPFEFTIGQRNMLPGFENAVIGMQKGKTKTITLPPEEAYGPYKEERIFTTARSGFPDHVKLEVGKRLQVRLKDGQIAFATIKYITDNDVILDVNDPLAGKVLSFKIELVEISPKKS